MRKVIVISGANLFSGGTLTIMQDCLKYLSQSRAKEYHIIALINDLENFKEIDNIEFMEIPSMRKSYFHRLYYEYYKYKTLSNTLNPYLWLSINDMSSNVTAKHRAVYCHNPSPFRKTTINDVLDQPQLFFFTLFYKYLYKINIHKNDYVIVQQNWIKNEFINFFNLNPEKIIVARPLDESPSIAINLETSEIIFFYPAVSRPFKNFEVIIQAVKLLKQKTNKNFNVVLTIDGSENNYAKRMIELASGIKEIQFTGFLSRDKVIQYYKKASCLIFPSKLETWGLPITEFKAYHKPLFLADLPYAKETLGKYDKAIFFNTADAKQLSELMFQVINSQPLKYSNTEEVKYENPSTKNWKELFNILLKKNNE
ncbi:glycosyltransferase [Pedobacter alpinus]|uniref:Glycosyltransferase n=1 Tax=Pedobacter alpinus TaxID=1590643 RepID=A0ABW5TQI0_9SPHI